MFRKKVTFTNTITTFILQLTTIASGFIIPKIILSYFGSDVNGLVSSLTKFLGYITIVDGGLAGVVTASLYKPITNEDHQRISAILKTTHTFYNKISFIFVVYTLALAIVYPLIFNTGFSFLYVFSLTVILSISMMIQYLYSLTIRTLLIADKKIYIISITQTVILILGIVLAYISVKVYPSIHLLQFLIGVLFILQPVIYSRACKKFYQIDQSVQEDEALIKNRWNGFAINLAAFIHEGTDVIVLTIFKSLAIVSVYSVYAIVASGIKRIISSLTSSLNPTLGQAYAKNDFEDLNKKLNVYEYIIFLLVYFTFSLAILLIVPFVLLYTGGITDANYNQPVFATLLLISEAFYLLKYPHLNLAYSANKYKEIAPSGFIEAGINIVLSVLLVPHFGLIGVVIGTNVAMVYRMIYHVWYTSTIVETRKQSIFYSKLIIFTLVSFVGILICSIILPFTEYSIIGWFWHAIVYAIIIGGLLFCTSVLYYREELVCMFEYMSKK